MPACTSNPFPYSQLPVGAGRPAPLFICEITTFVPFGCELTKVIVCFFAGRPLSGTKSKAGCDYDTNQAEEFEITSITLRSETINGIEVIITQCHVNGSAQYRHFVGELADPEVIKTMPIAAEVALLNRNIHVHGASAPATPMWGGKIQVGHLSGPLPGTTFPPAPVVKLYWVEFSGLGNRLKIAEYPFHFHHAGPMTTAMIDGCSFRKRTLFPCPEVLIPAGAG